MTSLFFLFSQKPIIVRKILSDENSDEINEEKAIISLMQLSTQYLINTYFKTAKSFRYFAHNFYIIALNKHYLNDRKTNLGISVSFLLYIEL